MTEKRIVVFASNNLGKIREVNSLAAVAGVKVISQSEFGVPEVEETGTTFVENALIKARHAAKYSPYPVIADDSGIILDALQGRPGIYSARFAGVGASDAENLEKLINEVSELPEHQRHARFVCLMVYLQHQADPTPKISEETWCGVALTKPRGKYGFGYDPMFYLPDHGCTSAELDLQTKNQLSHRGKALRKLIRLLE